MKKQIMIFISSIILFWCDWFLIGLIWNKYIDSLYTIVILALPIILLTMVASGILIIRETYKKIKNPTNINKPIINICKIICTLVVLIVICSHYISYNKTMNKNFEVGGFGPISYKETIKDSYYFYIGKSELYKQVRFECDKKTYDAIIVDDMIIYTFEYRLDFFNQKHGIMKTIDLKNYIDNRKK